MFLQFLKLLLPTEFLHELIRIHHHRLLHLLLDLCLDLLCMVQLSYQIHFDVLHHNNLLPLLFPQYILLLDPSGMLAPEQLDLPPLELDDSLDGLALLLTDLRTAVLVLGLDLVVELLLRLDSRLLLLLNLQHHVVLLLMERCEDLFSVFPVALSDFDGGHRFNFLLF